MEDLLRTYPELGQSMIGDVLKSVQNDVVAARQVLDDFATREPSDERLERMLSELDAFNVCGKCPPMLMFQELGRDVIIATLKENDWDVDKAVLPLFNKLERHLSDKRAKAYEEERKAREQKAKTEANAFLKELFRAVPEEKIQEILETNDGDVDATTEELVRYMDKLDAQSKREREERDRQRNIENLVIRFGFRQDETRDVLASVDWDLSEAVQLLVKRDTERKIGEFVVLYPTLTEEEIRNVAGLEGFNMVKVQAALTLRVKDKKEALERRKREEEERIKTEEEERIRSEEEAKRREEEEAQAKHNEQLRQELERKRREEAERKLEEENRKREEKLRLRRELEAKAKREKEEEERIKKAKEQTQELLLQQSIQITKEMVEAANKNAEKEDVREIVKKQLEEKMRQGADLPGIKATEVEVKKADRVELQSQSLPVDTKPEPASFTESLKQRVDNDVVCIKLSPERVDCGKALVAEWEHSAEATSRDWIALYLEGKSGREYVTYEWVSMRKGMFRALSVTAKGTISFSAPHVCGKYYVTYFNNGRYENYGVSNSVSVGPVYELQAKLAEHRIYVSINLTFGAPSPQAWIAMYPSANAGLNDYYTYQWVRDNKQLVFDVPKTGKWHFKLFPQRTLQYIASCDLAVEGENELALSTSDNFAVVKYSVVTLDPTTDNIWIGIYHQEEGNQRQWRRYKKITDKEGTLQFKKMIHNGNYEARLFANKTYEVRHKSNVISIVDGLN